MPDAGVLPYKVTFENAATATAPAQQVTITDQLGPNVDWSTFQLAAVGFGDVNLAVPAGSQSYQATVAITYAGTTFDVVINAGIHTATGQVYASFYSLDPLTGLPPAVLFGFLPPEDGTGRGQGYVSYTVAPKANLANGTAITNVASISFDGQPGILTDQVDDEDPTQGIDPTKIGDRHRRLGPRPPAPSRPCRPPRRRPASPSPGPARTPAGPAWPGTPSTSRPTAGRSPPWLTNTTATTGTYAGAAGHTYAFYSVATDNVGNVQPTPAAAQATTTVVVGNTAPADPVRPGRIPPARRRRPAPGRVGQRHRDRHPVPVGPALGRLPPSPTPGPA